jgi:hypothetical protein
MLAADEKRLRWMGVDMRPRWRRRWAVGLTYGFYCVAAVTVDSWFPSHPVAVFWVITAAVAWLGVFRDNRLLKKFDVPQTRDRSKKVMVGSLDEWARYRYGAAGFEESTEEQKAELLKTYRVGTYLMPWREELDSDLPDEREAALRDAVSRRTLVLMGSFLVSWAAQYSSRMKHAEHVSGLEVVQVLLSAALMAITLPRAMVLWEERDPREIGGEMELVGREG